MQIGFNRVFARWTVIAMLAACAGAHASGSGYAYMSGDVEPFYDYSNQDAMNAAFGASDWNRINFGDAFSNYEMLYIDGGSAEDSDAFVQYLDGHRGELESYVLGGGRLFINAATEFEAQPISLVFGATSTELSDSDKSLEANAVDPQSALFANAGSTWEGGFFAHNALSTLDGFTPLIQNSGAEPYTIVAGGAFGTGYVLLGGQTNTSFHWSSPDGSDPFQLRVNELLYTADVPLAPPVPEPRTLALLLGGLCALAALTRRRRSVD
jgi:hypothetical protein